MIPDQSMIDHMIEEVHWGAPAESGGFGADVAGRGLMMVGAGETILSFSDTPPTDWAPEWIDEIADDLDEDRIEELRNGAELDEDETELWQAAIERLWDITKSVDIVRCVHSQHPERRAYLGWHYATCGQSSDLYGWFGPVAKASDLVAFVVAETRDWRSASANDGFDDVSEVEHFREGELDSEKEIRDAELDDQDERDAELLFRAVKDARAS